MGTDDEQIASTGGLSIQGTLTATRSFLPILAEAHVCHLLRRDVMTGDVFVVPVIPEQLPNWHRAPFC
jgi:hypothetical protein